MARISIAGVGIEYELLGEAGAPALALTPGGRFPLDTPGLRELGQALAAGGKRVLLWDRPNCGASDISFEGDSESELHARVLIGLIRSLGLGPTAIAGGSAGSRVSLIAASRDPQIVSHLAIWWISGGPIGLANVACSYTLEAAMAAAQGGMEAVLGLPSWTSLTVRNPRNRERVLAQQPDEFIEKMQQWARAYAYSDVSPVPGMSPDDFARLRMPTRIFRNGQSDIHHPRQTSEWVGRMIPQSSIVEPPWPDSEWNNRANAFVKEGRGLFEGWPALAPALLAFTRTESVGVIDG
jgi:pimeloyl-ACP methyl ester carboxylesterase